MQFSIPVSFCCILSHTFIEQVIDVMPKFGGGPSIFCGIIKHVYYIIHASQAVRCERLAIARNRTRLVVNRNRIFAPYSLNLLFSAYLLFDA